MPFIETASILRSPSRQRKEIQESRIRELADSITKPEIGLLHPPVLRRTPEGLVLVAGETRKRAVEDCHSLGIIPFFQGAPIPPGKIPYTDLGSMSALAAWEAELEENVVRTDLTWQDRAAATAELMKLREAQAAEQGKPKPTYADLSEEISGKRTGGSVSDLREEVILARYLDDPDVKAATSPKEAMKVLMKKEQVAKHTKLAQQVGRTFSAADHRILHEDSKIALGGENDSTYDVILTDPPYGMGADGFGDSGGKAEGAHGYADDAKTLEEITFWFPSESFRIAKPQAHLYLFLDFDWWTLWKSVLTAAGWSVFRTPLIWHKPNGYRAPWPDRGPQRRYETLLFASKGDKPVTKMGGDVMSFQADENLGHAAQKPVGLYKELLSRSCLPGDRAIDPFCGTGPIFPAAHDLQVKATGVEMDEVSYGIAAKRLKELK